MRVRCDELLCDLKAEKKAGAGRGNIKTSGLGGPDLFLNETGCRGKEHVGSGRGDENKIDFGGRNFRLFDRLQRRFRGHVARLFVFRGDATFLDPGASRDPFVAGIDHARQIFVGQNFFRHVTSSADDRDGAPQFSGA